MPEAQSLVTKLKNQTYTDELKENTEKVETDRTENGDENIVNEDIKEKDPPKPEAKKVTEYKKTILLPCRNFTIAHFFGQYNKCISIEV